MVSLFVAWINSCDITLFVTKSHENILNIYVPIMTTYNVYTEYGLTYCPIVLSNYKWKYVDVVNKTHRNNYLRTEHN